MKKTLTALALIISGASFSNDNAKPELKLKCVIMAERNVEGRRLPIELGKEVTTFFGINSKKYLDIKFVSQNGTNAVLHGIATISSEVPQIGLGWVEVSLRTSLEIETSGGGKVKYDNIAVTKFIDITKHIMETPYLYGSVLYQSGVVTLDNTDSFAYHCLL